jgi:hypothetical protein
MAREKRRRRKSRTQDKHSPNRRKALKGIATFIGDKALGGLIGSAATAAATYVATKALTRAPTAYSLHAEAGIVKVVGSDTTALALTEALPITDALSIMVIRKESPTTI